MSLIPMVVERDGNSERSYDLKSRLLKDRIIWVDEPIAPPMANNIKAQLLWLESEDPNADITMYIDSPGGEVTTGLGIYDTMKYISCDVSTVCGGMAASMGSLLLMGGATGKRLALPHSEIMIHQPSGGAQGKASDVEIQYKNLQRCKETLTELYVEHTGHTYEELLKDMDRDNFMTAQEAKAYGLIDDVITHRR